MVKFKEMWEIIEMPVIVLVAWSLITFIIPIQDLIGNNIVYGIISWCVTIVLFGWVGYNVVQSKHEISAPKAGAIAGAISGFIGGVIALITYFVNPQFYALQIEQAIAQGAPEETIRIGIQIGLFIGLIIGPVISAVIGAVITWISSLVFKKKKK